MHVSESDLWERSDLVVPAIQLALEGRAVPKVRVSVD
jgi:hypothetical protein